MKYIHKGGITGFILNTNSDPSEMAPTGNFFKHSTERKFLQFSF